METSVAGVQRISELTDAALLSIKLLTLNTHKGFTSFNRRFVLQELREAVRGVAADVVCLQEVIGEHHRHARRVRHWPAVSQYEYLADSIWPEFAYGRNAVYTKGHHGNAVLSKFPIRQYRNHDISVGTRERRGLLHCELTVPARATPVHVICTHLSLVESSRQQQLQQLGTLLRTAIPPDAPLIVAGDFNDWRLRGHTSLVRLTALKEAFVELGGAAARSFPSRWPLLRLDRIYYQNLHLRSALVHARQPWSQLSDHLALSVELAL